MPLGTDLVVSWMPTTAGVTISASQSSAAVDDLRGSARYLLLGEVDWIAPNHDHPRTAVLSTLSPTFTGKTILNVGGNATKRHASRRLRHLHVYAQAATSFYADVGPNM